MHRFGILSFASPGHYYPISALGRRLQSRGHEVVYFQIADIEPAIRAAGLEYHQIGLRDFPAGATRERNKEIDKLRGMAALRSALRHVARCTEMVLRDAPGAIRAARVDALIVDQLELAGGTVAERLGIPFVSVAAALPINLDPSVPPVYVPWTHGKGPLARLRNRVGNENFSWVFSGVLRTINQQRREWKLPAARNFNALFSKRTQVGQLPAALELPGRILPSKFHHTGPWTDSEARAAVDFPWERLDPSRPLAYVSMGTLQNGVIQTFRMIAEACANLPLQLVISLGGGHDPALVGELPGDPVVVGYAPQLELIRRAALTISHGGLNTTLESLANGVPMVVLPIAYDQPGVGVRVELAGVGRSIPVGRLTVGLLRDAIRTVLIDPDYRWSAGRLQAKIEAADGLNHAADVIETAFGVRSTGKEVAAQAS